MCSCWFSRCGGELFDIIIKRVEAAEDTAAVKDGGAPAMPYSEAEVAKVLRQIVQAVNQCHVNGIVHRDLKVCELECPALPCPALQGLLSTSE